MFVLWWGAGDASRIAVIVVGCLIPIVISSYHGAHAVPARAGVVGARARDGARALWLRVILPAALPQILSGLRIAIAISIFTVLGLGAADPRLRHRRLRCSPRSTTARR